MGSHPLAGVVLAMAAAAWSAPAQQAITISVFNSAGAPDAVVARGIELADHALRTAGLAALWVACNPEGCDQARPSGERRLELFILPRPKAPLPRGAALDSAGFALKGDFLRPRAYAFYEVVNAVAERADRPVAVVLAHVLLHEAGHLLGLDHQVKSVMHPYLDPDVMDATLKGNVFFSREREKIHAAALELMKGPAPPATPEH